MVMICAARGEVDRIEGIYKIFIVLDLVKIVEWHFENVFTSKIFLFIIYSQRTIFNSLIQLLMRKKNP